MYSKEWFKSGISISILLNNGRDLSKGLQQSFTSPLSRVAAESSRLSVSKCVWSQQRNPVLQTKSKSFEEECISLELGAGGGLWFGEQELDGQQGGVGRGSA